MVSRIDIALSDTWNICASDCTVYPGASIACAETMMRLLGLSALLKNPADCRHVVIDARIDDTWLSIESNAYRSGVCDIRINGLSHESADELVTLLKTLAVAKPDGGDVL